MKQFKKQNIILNRRVGDIEIPDPGEEEDEEAIIERRRKEREALFQVCKIIDLSVCGHCTKVSCVNLELEREQTS